MTESKFLSSNPDWVECVGAFAFARFVHVATSVHKTLSVAYEAWSLHLLLKGACGEPGTLGRDLLEVRKALPVPRPPNVPVIRVLWSLVVGT